jgi:hypothetical protein
MAEYKMDVKVYFPEGVAIKAKGKVAASAANAIVAIVSRPNLDEKHCQMLDALVAQLSE